MIKPFNKAELSFDLLKEIGQEGANSNAYLAFDHQLGAQIVIKKIAKNSLDSVDAFFDESKILYLSSHPNVVPIYYGCQDEDSIYIAMPYYSQGSLNKLINSRFLTVREIVTLACQVASGLHNIHSKKLVHFDVKPDNVLLSDRGEALISDFGLSRRLNNAGVAGQDRFYMKMRPPEAYDRPEHTPAFDIYQFGVMLYRMCNGNGMYNEQFDKFGTTPATFDRDGFKFAVRNGRFPDRTIFEEHIPQRLRRLIKKCIEPNPDNRFRAAIEVANELAQIDDKLDWQFSTDGSSRTWCKRNDGREYQLTVDQGGAAVAEKTLESGRRMKIPDYCKASITAAEIRRFLGDT